MKLRLLLLLLAARLLCAADGTRVQVLAIAAPEQLVAQAALQTAPGDEGRLFDEMAGLVAAGEAEILSDHLLTAPGVELMREVPSILGSSVKIPGYGQVLEAPVMFYNCGGFLTLFPATATTPAQLSWSADFNEPGMPTLEELKTAAAQQTKLPEFNKTGIGLQKPLPSKSGAGAFLLSLAPAEVPASHPERGRWHAVLIFTRKN